VTEPVALESIRSCLQGVIPSPLASCSADGTPNVTYMSIVQYVDSERVALSRQFFNKTRANLDENALAQVQVVDPATLARYALDLRYLQTETEGPSSRP
jgi:predicted pyridoxine 5'-phosphate oxidase superfamily flavin-nucleotide-binding protein